MMKRFQEFLGPVRFWLFLFLLVSTGFLSLILSLSFGDNPNTVAIQTLLLFVFIISATMIIVSRLEGHSRARWLAILIPAAGLIVLGTLFVPEFSGAFIGAASGWIVAGWFLFIRSRAPMEYRQAIKHMRRGEYAQAVDVMTKLIKVEPNDPNHYRFRAELLRLWGKLGRAKRDYQKMIELTSDSAVGYNGLAEVLLQAGEYAEAHGAARKAFELAPDEWVAAYNLGMIEDRLQCSEDAIRNLQRALDLQVPDSRHRLLIYFYLVRAYRRLSDEKNALAAAESLKRERNGLKEWETILGSDQAQTLREVLAEDISIARQLLNDEISFHDLE